MKAAGHAMSTALLRLAVADETKARELARYAEYGRYDELARELEQVLERRDALVIARAFQILRPICHNPDDDRGEER
jgi:hypothetical protein